MEDRCSKLATVYIIIYYYIFRALHTEYIYIYISSFRGRWGDEKVCVYIWLSYELSFEKLTQ